MASNTGCRSVGELEMTLRISAVAVCCSSDSVVARARLHLVEQPRVLDRDQRPGRGRIGQSDFVRAERCSVRYADQRKQADALPLAQQRQVQGAVRAVASRGCCARVRAGRRATSPARIASVFARIAREGKLAIGSIGVFRVPGVAPPSGEADAATEKASPSQSITTARGRSRAAAPPPTRCCRTPAADRSASG